jgi:FkbM family methyltransferase
MHAARVAASLLRRLTGSLVYRKRLPQEFGGTRIYVTSRADIRLLVPGFSASAADLLRVASAYVRPGDCVWDIGANLGIFAFCASWKAGAEGIVFSLDADPYYISLQHKSARGLSRGYARVTPLCAAVADKMAVLELAIPQRGAARSHLATVQGNDTGETECTKQVVSVTADFLLDYWRRPDFVKVDIEGAELLFLAGAARLVQEVRPAFYIEVNERNSDRATAIFRAHRYKLFAAPDGRHFVEQDRCRFNTLAQPAEKC